MFDGIIDGKNIIEYFMVVQSFLFNLLLIVNSLIFFGETILDEIQRGFTIFHMSNKVRKDWTRMISCYLLVLILICSTGFYI